MAPLPVSHIKKPSPTHGGGQLNNILLKLIRGVGGTIVKTLVKIAKAIKKINLKFMRLIVHIIYPVPGLERLNIEPKFDIYYVYF